MHDDALALPDNDIDTLANYFTGKRRELFLDSVAVVRESLALGGWVKRGAQRADKGFNKGLVAKSLDIAWGYDERGKALMRLGWAVSHGRRLPPGVVDIATDDDIVRLAPKVPVPVTRAWLRLMVALRDVWDDLDASRPLPVYTEIGLSRKVTATLQDANLDLDLTTRRLCPLGSRWVPAINTKTGEPFVGRDGKPAMVKVYFPKWPAGTVFGTSRFADCDCEACGKRIPSGLVVPVLVADKAGAIHGFWFGRDCARNILGLKDAGIPDARAGK